MKRSRALIAAVALVALVASEPAAAFRGQAYHGGMFVAKRGNPDYGYGYNCRNNRYGYNCPYYELPDWNGPMEIRNPGG
jgi:hypothetical protein